MASPPGTQPITHLRHVDLAVPEFARQLDFYTSVWGLTQVGGDTGVAFLAAEGSPEQYVLRLRRGDKRLDLYDLHDPAVQDQWGTANPMNELVAKESFNDEDPGLFVAPPL